MTSGSRITFLYVAGFILIKPLYEFPSLPLPCLVHVELKNCSSSDTYSIIDFIIFPYSFLFLRGKPVFKVSLKMYLQLLHCLMQ